jgi:hypothetical protein
MFPDYFINNQEENIPLVRDKKANYFEPILYIPVLQTGHFAFNAGLPFFMVTFSGLATSLFALHFTQYIDAIYLIHLPS